MNRATKTRAARRAGFTLVELMIAMTIAAFVIATVYTIGGASARNFQEQQRVGQTQMATRLGLDRLRRDIERAGLHGTPNSQTERLGATPVRQVVAVGMIHNDATSRAGLAGIEALAANTTIQNDSLTLTGNFSSSDAYLVRGFDGTGSTAYLQTSWQGFRRSFVDAGDATGATWDAALFAQVFAPGRMLHIRTIAGNHFFVTISSASLTGTGATGTTAQVAFTPALGVGGAVGGLAEGALIAPLSMIQYTLMAAPPDNLGPTGDGTRDITVTGPNTALVRRELNMSNGAVIPGRSLTVLEWAIHFDVDVVMDTAIAPAPPVPQQFDDVAAATQVAASPERVRALIVEIGARTPEQDPGFPWTAPVAGGPLAAFQVFSTRPGAARVRTGRIEVSLPNLVYRN